MKGFCTYHGVGVSHERARDMLNLMFKMHGQGWPATHLALLVDDEIGGEIDKMPKRSQHDADMRIADAIIAYGKRVGLIEHSKKSRLWVRREATQ
jgi:hypothetical protein